MSFFDDADSSNANVRTQKSIVALGRSYCWKNVRIVSSVRFHMTGHLEIGDNTWIGHEVMIVGGDAKVCIGNNVDIAPRVMLVTGTHEHYGFPGKAAGADYSQSIIIGDGAWIGAASTILGGVVIGNEFIIAAGTLVRSNIQDCKIHAGVPNRLIGHGSARC